MDHFTLVHEVVEVGELRDVREEINHALTDKLLGSYSKGMRRKVVITAALLHNPPVVFFDEPLDGLDANAAVGFKTLIQNLAREGITFGADADEAAAV